MGTTTSAAYNRPPMSQFTRCPFCETTFKVVVDQLRVSQGWVRCGHCKKLFDASRHLHGTQVSSQPLLPQSVPDASSAPPPVAPPIPSAPQPGPVPRHSAPEVAPPAPSALLDLPLPTPPNTPTHAPPEAEPSETLPERPASRKRRSSRSRSKSAHSPDSLGAESVTRARKEKRRHTRAAPEPPDSESSEYDSDLEFVRAARRNAFWRRPVVRAAVGFLVLLLAGSLLLQIALQERDALAARYPATQAGLARLCASFGCTVQAPRRIDAVVIDSSSFLKARGDDNTYQLQMDLKNTAPTAIAMPALELTLLDTQDQVTLRRVLLPSDLAAPEQLSGNGSWGAKVAVRVAAPTAQVAGYRVEAFYP